MTFLIALWNNVHALAVTATIVSAIASIVLGFGWAMCTTDASSCYGTEKDGQHAAICLRYLKRAVVALGCGAVLAAIPDVNDLWRARIALVKLELASPENVQKGTEEIARIARRLECKYLGCEEEKKEKR
jgi:hypothetical protein